MKIQDFINRGIRVINDMNELRIPSRASIPFSNGWVASIVTTDNGYSVAVCDYNGYFNWGILNSYGAERGKFQCKTEDEVCNALAIIESLPN